jgi:hypothetical protein
MSMAKFMAKFMPKFMAKFPVPLLGVASIAGQRKPARCCSAGKPHPPPHALRRRKTDAFAIASLTRGLGSPASCHHY